MSSRNVELCVDRFDIEFLDDPNLEAGGCNSMLKLSCGDVVFSVIVAACAGSGFFVLK